MLYFIILIVNHTYVTTKAARISIISNFLVFNCFISLHENGYLISVIYETTNTISIKYCYPVWLKPFTCLVYL